MKKTLIILSLFFTIKSFASEVKDIEEATNLVNKFCVGEFNGSDLDVRQEQLTFSNKYMQDFKRLHEPLVPATVEWEQADLIVIRNFKILVVKIEKLKGDASVEYIQVAHKTRFKLELDKENKIIVKLKLKKIGKSWRVLDPPIPKIGINKAIEIFTDNYNFVGKDWEKMAGEEAILNHNLQKQNIELLKSISNFN